MPKKIKINLSMEVQFIILPIGLYTYSIRGFIYIAKNIPNDIS